jgi:hypothetical protein
LAVGDLGLGIVIGLHSRFTGHGPTYDPYMHINS